MTNVDCARCAEALATATVEQLREDAEAIIPWAMALSDPVAGRFYRLAGLALAVARVQKAGRARIEQGGGRDFLILDIPIPSTKGLGYGACDLAPALAALVRGEP